MDWSGSGEDEVVCWRSGAFELSAETDAFWFMGAIISANPAWAQPALRRHRHRQRPNLLRCW